MKSSAHNSHIYGLDILRIISALAVMFYHFAFRGEAAGELPAINIPETIKAIASYGSLGVSVFFIISGYVIAYSAEGQKPWQFMIARFTRIYPTFFMMMTLTAATIWFSSNPLFHVSVHQYLANTIIFSKLLGEPFVDGAYWSIVLEVIFYGWIFIILALGQFRNILRIIPIWLAFSFANEFYIGSEHLQNLFITEHSGFFAMGIILNRLYRQFSYYACVLFISAAGYSIYAATAGIAWAEAAYSTTFSPGVIAIIILFSISIFLLMLRLKINERYWQMLSILGGATYSLYLLHQNIGYIAIERLLDYVSPLSAITLTMLSLIAFSIIFHVTVEKRLNPMLRRQLLRFSLKPRIVTS
ncbi:acyltransferase family protein [Brucella pituitosa]|uniref:acyltransferase family protein n=1 Tax=Brucella pituitosa TaxID=571256 RepID=UPI003F4A8C96